MTITTYRLTNETQDLSRRYQQRRPITTN